MEIFLLPRYCPDMLDLNLPPFGSCRLTNQCQGNPSSSKTELLIHEVLYHPSSIEDKIKECKKKRISKETIHDKLEALYTESRRNAPKDFIHCNLLKALVLKENLNVLVISLYDLETGFTFSIKSKYGEQLISKMPYQNSTLLENIDKEEIPHGLFDLLYPHNLVYNSCCIAEVRDFRMEKYNIQGYSRYVLLKPSMFTFSESLEMYIKECKGLSPKEQNQLLFETSAPLYLDTDLTVVECIRSLHYYRKAFATLNDNPVEKQSRYVKTFHYTKFPTTEEIEFYRCMKKFKLPFEEIDLSSLTFTDSPLPGGDSCEPFDFYSDGFQSITPYVRQRMVKIVKSNSSDKPSLIETFIFESSKEENTTKDCNFHHKLLVYQMSYDFPQMYHVSLHLNCKTKEKAKASLFQVGSRKDIDNYICQLTRKFSDNYLRFIKVTRREAGRTATLFYENRIPIVNKAQSETALQRDQDAPSFSGFDDQDLSLHTSVCETPQITRDEDDKSEMQNGKSSLLDSNVAFSNTSEHNLKTGDEDNDKNVTKNDKASQLDDDVSSSKEQFGDMAAPFGSSENTQKASEGNDEENTILEQLIKWKLN